MKSVLIFLLLFFASTVNSQTIIEGHITDDKKNDLIKATVKCYDDSMYICGTTTNIRGEFKIEVPASQMPNKITVNYIGYKETAITIIPTDEKQIRLGDIVMGTNATVLKEVTVMSSNRIKMEDKTMIFPTKDEIRHAYDGYSMLDVMWIPGLTANSINGNVSYHHESVKLCINGREATKEEIQDLNPKDIKRIDFYTQGTPEYPEDGSVIDYILKERDYLGSISFNATHYNRPNGNGKTTVQYFEGKSEFAISASGKYNNFTQRPEENTTTIYHFPENDIIRTAQNLSSASESNEQNMYANYLYKDKIKNFYASLRFNRNETENRKHSNLEYNNAPVLYTKQEYSASQKINPAIQLRYNHSLPAKQRIRVEAYASYGNNHYSRWYENLSNNIIASNYNNGTLEDSYYASGSVNYNKTFKNRSSLNVLLSHNFTHTNDINTRENNIYGVSLGKNNSKLHLTYKYNIKKRFSIQTSIATHLTTVKTGDRRKTDLFFIPQLKLTYMHKQHTISLSGTAMSREVSNANRTGDEYRINEYEMFVGNPMLKDYMDYTVTINHSWDISSRLAWFNYAKYKYSTDRNYRLINYDDNRDLFVNRVINNGSYWSQHYESGADYSIIPKKLRIRGVLIYEYAKAEAWRRIYHGYLHYGITSSFMQKGWRLSAGYLSGGKGLDPDWGRMTKSSGELFMQLNYSINNWHFEAYYMNPFKSTSKSEINNGEYEQYHSSRIPRITDNFAYIHIRYRFTFGKKKHKFDTTEVEDVNQTTISQ